MRGALRDDTKYSCVPKVKLGRILKLNLNSVINPLKPYYTENEDSFGFKLWPRFARFFFAFVPTRFGFFFSSHFPFANVNLCVPHRRCKMRISLLATSSPGRFSLALEVSRCHSVLCIPIPKSLAFWASPGTLLGCRVERTARYFQKGCTVSVGYPEMSQNYEYCITTPRTFVQNWR